MSIIERRRSCPAWKFAMSGTGLVGLIMLIIIELWLFCLMDGMI